MPAMNEYGSSRCSPYGSNGLPSRNLPVSADTAISPLQRSVNRPFWSPGTGHAEQPPIHRIVQPGLYAAVFGVFPKVEPVRAASLTRTREVVQDDDRNYGSIPSIALNALTSFPCSIPGESDEHTR